MKIKFKRKNLNLFLIIFFIISILFYYDMKISSQTEFSNFNLTGQKLEFDINQNILVFVHIQKTGGSDFDRNIVKYLQRKKNSNWQNVCEFIGNVSLNETRRPKTVDNYPFKKVKFKKYVCKKDHLETKREEPNWYFSRQTFGWICGIHPDFTDITSCVKKYYNQDKFSYFTILREPIQRYISEWRHVSRGATWIRKKGSNCLNSYKNCFKGSDLWLNVTLDEFMSCKFNLANNRQTRMLANYDKGFKLCLNPQFLNESEEYKRDYETEMLERAKMNLQKMNYFAITEYQNVSQALFVKLFGEEMFRFSKPLAQSNFTIAGDILNNFEHENNVSEKIREINYLDAELYNFALKLFFQRLQFYKIL